MNIIVYTNHCLSCHSRKRLRQIQDFAESHGTTVEQRRTTYNKEWMQEANELSDKFGVLQPFVAYGNKVIRFNDELEKLL